MAEHEWEYEYGPSFTDFSLDPGDVCQKCGKIKKEMEWTEECPGPYVSPPPPPEPWRARVRELLAAKKGRFVPQEDRPGQSRGELAFDYGYQQAVTEIEIGLRMIFGVDIAGPVTPADPSQEPEK